MQLIKLELENIRSYVDCEISFDPGSNLLVGDIGSGKSTVLQAVEFALFGIVRGLNEAQHLIRNGSNTGKVVLTFKIQDMIVEVTRTLKRTKQSVMQGNGWLKIENITDSSSNKTSNTNQSVEYAPTELKSKIHELLGYSYDATNIFRYTVYANQENIKQIILDKPENRMDTLRKVFGIDRYKKIIQNSAMLTREFRTKKKIEEAKMSDLSEIQIRFAELAQLQDQLVRDEQSAQIAVKECTTQREIIEAEFEKIKISKTEFETANTTKINLEQKNVLLKQVITKPLPGIDDKELELAKIPVIEKPNLVEIERVLSDHKLQFEKNVSREKTLQEKILGIKQLQENILRDIQRNSVAFEVKNFDKITNLGEQKKELKEKEKRKNEITNEITIITEKLSSISEKMQSNAKDICPVCLQKISADHKESLSTHLSQEKKTLEDKKIILSNTMQQITKELIAASIVEKEYDLLIKEKAQYDERLRQQELQKELVKVKKEQVEKLNADEKIIQKEIQELVATRVAQSKIQELETRVLETRTLQEKYDLRKKLEEEISKLKINLATTIEQKRIALEEYNKNKEELEKINQKLAQNAEIVGKYEVYKQKLDELRTKEQNLKIKIATLVESVKNTKQNRENSKIELDKRKTAKHEKEWLEHTTHWFENYLSPLMEHMEKYVLTQIKFEFEKLCKDWFKILLEDDSFDIKFDENFTPIIMHQGADLSIDSLSGGERTSVALAYRLALSKIVHSFVLTHTQGLLILDEPTEGFSFEQMEKMRDVLSELKANQIIIVSHEPQMASFVSKTIVVKKEQGSSSIEV